MINTKKKSFWLILFVTLSSFMLLTAWVVNPLLKNLLATQVENKLVGKFYYSYKNLKVDLISRSITFEKINWKFPKDTSVFNQSGFVNEFKIEGISLLSLFGGSNVRIENVTFDSLMLLTRIERLSKEDSLPESAPFNFYSLIGGQIPGVEIRSIKIKNGNAIWLNPENNRIWGKINKVQLSVNSFNLDSATAAANNGWFSFQNFSLEGVTGELYLADSLHKIQTAKIQLNYQTSKIIIDSLKLIPLFTKSEMRYKRKYETNRIELFVPRITITGIGIKRLMVKNELRIEKVLLDQLNLNAFRDKSPPLNPHHFPSLPQLALLQAGLNLKIDSVCLKDAFIEYEELSNKTQKVGKVFFARINAKLSNITNDSISYQQNTFATLCISTQFMGIGKLEVHGIFNLSDPNGDHSIKGTLGKLDLTSLNKVFEPLTAVSIRSGFLNQLNFNVRLNNDVSNGEVTFLYSNLKIDKLNEKHLQDHDFDNSIKSLLANTFVIKKSNPSGNRDPRIGTVHFKRVKEKAIFNFWLKSVLDGMKFTVLSE